MASLYDDLDRFLKTEGLRIIIDAGGARTEPYKPLTEKDIDSFTDMNLDSLDASSLEDLLDRAEDLLDNLEDSEPGDESSDEYALWADRISETDDFIDRIRNRMDDP